MTEKVELRPDAISLDYKVQSVPVERVGNSTALPLPRLAKVQNVLKMRARAKKAMPRAIFDFIDGAAEQEISRRRNRSQFDNWGFVHRVGVDVSRIDMSVELFGDTYDAPFGIGPTGLAGLAWPKAETLIAQGAKAANIPFCLSTVSSVRLEEVAENAGAGLWFQLYIFKDRGLARELVSRAKQAGYKVLVITVDCATGGNRERDPKNDFTLPLRPTMRSALDILRRPGWIGRLLANGAPKPENMVEAAAKAAQNAQGLVVFMSEQLDPSVTWREVEEFVELWDGPVVIKGVLSAEDAGTAVKIGADGFILSNHGGRQLDGAVSSLHVVERVRDAVGPSPTIFCDGGFRRGADILKARALGANAVLMGRNTLYGVGAAGRPGVDHVIHLLKTEVERALVLLGVPRVSDLTRDHLMDMSRLPPAPLKAD